MSTFHHLDVLSGAEILRVEDRRAVRDTICAETFVFELVYLAIMVVYLAFSAQNGLPDISHLLEEFLSMRVIVMGFLLAYVLWNVKIAKYTLRYHVYRHTDPETIKETFSQSTWKFRAFEVIVWLLAISQGCFMIMVIVIPVSTSETLHMCAAGLAGLSAILLLAVELSRTWWLVNLCESRCHAQHKKTGRDKNKIQDKINCSMIESFGFDRRTWYRFAARMIFDLAAMCTCGGVFVGYALGYANATDRTAVALAEYLFFDLVIHVRHHTQLNVFRPIHLSWDAKI